MDLSLLAQSVAALNTKAQANPDHFFKSDWRMVDMNLHAYEAKYKKLGEAMNLLRKEAKLANSESHRRHVKFLLLNLIQALKDGKLVALA